MIGHQLGHYRLVRLIGKGGFAEVFLGEHIHLQNRFAAIKVLSSLTPEEQDNFKREAQRLVELDGHSHIIRILDFGIDKNMPFLVMEYAPNGSLRTRHSRGTRLELTTVISYTKQIASALQYIHDHKLIHRDIKPENILLNANNEILLSDVGIATVAHSERSLTTQQIAGTPTYMAPEQIVGKAQPASDQYALAIMVYEWLGGAPPFVGDIRAMAYMHMHMAPPPLRERIATISSEVEHVIMMALAKEPAQRFIRIQAFATALEQASLSTRSDQVNVTIQPSTSLKSLHITTSILQPNQADVPVQRVTSPPQPPLPAEAQRNTEALYKNGRNAKVEGNLELALQYWEQVLSLDPNFLKGQLASLLVPELRNEIYQRRVERLRIEAEQAQSQGDWRKASHCLQSLLELEPDNAKMNRRALLGYLMKQAENVRNANAYGEEISVWERILEIENTVETKVQCLRLKANQASLLGNWEQEISIWKEVLALVPQDAQARRRIPLVEENWKSTDLYKIAQDFFSEGKTRAAEDELETLWKNAPYYGDPAGLAEKLGIEKVPLTHADYDKKEEERIRVQAQEKEEERIRAQEEEQKTARWFINTALSSNVLTVYTSFLFLLIGGGSLASLLAQSWYWAAGILTHPWHWALGAEVLLALLAYLLGYRRAMSLRWLLILSVLSSIIALILAGYMSTFKDGAQHISQLCLLPDKPLWVGRQINFGVFYSIIPITTWVVVAGRLHFFKRSSFLNWKNFFSILFIVIMCALLVWCIPASLGSLFSCGFGWGYGWHFSIIGLIAATLCSMGVGSLTIISIKSMHSMIYFAIQQLKSKVTI